MTTRYPDALPQVPTDRWNAEESVIAEDCTQAVTGFHTDADSAEQAEVRLLAWIDHDYQDDLRGATATALHQVRAGRWHVRLVVVGEF